MYCMQDSKNLLKTRTVSFSTGGSIILRMVLLFLILLIVSTAATSAQSDSMWDFAKKQEKPRHPRTFLSAQLLLIGQIRLYQLLLSEQQPDACNFSPSCSHFGYRAIIRKGPLEGALMAIDRLQRCNPWAWNYHGTHYGVTWVPGRGYKLTDPP
jgi:putative membrane protein insertion efficiency factor